MDFQLKSGENVKVKLCGDGTKMTWLNSFQPLSFSVLQTEETVIKYKSAQGNTVTS